MVEAEVQYCGSGPGCHRVPGGISAGAKGRAAQTYASAEYGFDKRIAGTE